MFRAFREVRTATRVFPDASDRQSVNLPKVLLEDDNRTNAKEILRSRMYCETGLLEYSFRIHALILLSFTHLFAKFPV